MPRILLQPQLFIRPLISRDSSIRVSFSQTQTQRQTKRGLSPLVRDLRTKSIAVK
jgi:hypothetical protein